MSRDTCDDKQAGAAQKWVRIMCRRAYGGALRREPVCEEEDEDVDSDM
jgi:hypothetical protein